MHTDERIRELRAAEFPLLEACTYLDHATVGPVPLRHARAASDVVTRLAHDGPTSGEGTRLLEAVRNGAAELLHAEARHIALLKSTSEGLGLLAQGLDWSPGDEVVLYEREFVACAAPFLHLRSRGVRVRWIADRGRNRFDLDDVAALITPRTRAVCVSVVNRSHGVRAPVEALGSLCREQGIWLALDAAQAMGVLDLDAPAIGADIVAAHGYKFLCSGFGLAVTYCSQRAIDELGVPQVGWKNAAVDHAGELVLVPYGEARRFESTMSSVAGLAGMQASLELLSELGAEERERRSVVLAAQIADGCAARGYELLCAREPTEASSLVVMRHPSIDSDQLVAGLSSNGVVCEAVDGAVRASTHAFNTVADVDALLAALPPA